MITRVHTVSIPVRDQLKAKQWYEEKLGFKTVADEPFDETGERRWIEMSTPEGGTRVTLFTPDGHEDRIGTHSTVVFTCDDVYKTTEELKARGVEFESDPVEYEWGVGALMKDLDGNIFCLSIANTVSV